MENTTEQAILENENTALRAIASKIMPCHYCGVDQIAKCPHGFPGCSLMDDLIAGDYCANRALRTERQIAGRVVVAAKVLRSMHPNRHPDTQVGQVLANLDEALADYEKESQL